MMRAKLLGTYYKIIRGVLPKGILGLCDWESRTITISDAKHVKGKLELDVTIHESIHGCLPELPEKVVDQMATDITEVLWKRGYRRS